MSEALEQPKEYALAARESNREAEETFTALINQCLGRDTAPARGAGLRLERAIRKLEEDWGLRCRCGAETKHGEPCAECTAVKAEARADFEREGS